MQKGVKKKAVLFDCDGVLVNTESISSMTLSDIFNRHGLPYATEARLEKFLGRSPAELAQLIEKDFRKVHGTGLPDGFIEKTGALYMSNVKKHIKIVPGTKRLLKSLDRAAIRTAVVSNSDSSALTKKLGLVGLGQRFGKHVYSADHVVHAKPAPDLYLLAMKKMGLKPQECIVVEDSPLGIEAAKAAGAYVIGFSGDHGGGLQITKAQMKAGADESYSSMENIHRRLHDLLWLSGKGPSFKGPRVA